MKPKIEGSHLPCWWVLEIAIFHGNLQHKFNQTINKILGVRICEAHQLFLMYQTFYIISIHQMHSSPKIQNVHSSLSFMPSQFQSLSSQDLEMSLQNLFHQHPHQGLKVFQDFHHIESNLGNQFSKEN